MIDHSKCPHPSTSGARAKCRRANGQYTEKFGPPLWSLGPPPKVRKVKEMDEEEDRYGQTPRDKGEECHTCGVERIEFYGRDAFTKLPVFVGERCAWRVKRSEEFRAVVR